MEHHSLHVPDQASPNTSLHVFRRSRRRWRQPLHTPHHHHHHHHHRTKEIVVANECVLDEKQQQEEKQEQEEEEEEDEKEEIEKKIDALQRIVPGGHSFGVDKLFDETAGYIVSLQYQVKALRALTSFFEKLHKDNTKFGA